MGEIRAVKPALLIAAISSRYPAAIDWACARARDDWGEVRLASPTFDFRETRYYEPTMGADLKKRLVAFGRIDPGRLADTKIASNSWEDEYRSGHAHPEPRPLNIDPGYLTEAKLVLATTKDRDHRIYLRDGIFAEVTLYYHGGQWRGSRWTYPDYQRPDYQAFLDECRQYVRTEPPSS